MSGAGKSSAVTGVLPHVEDDAAAVLDGNLSKISTAEERIKEALDAGKDPIIVYVWRDPVDAWVNGVVKRMKSNAEEGGRVVPMSEALKNGPGSPRHRSRRALKGREIQRGRLHRRQLTRPQKRQTHGPARNSTHSRIQTIYVIPF